MNYQLQTDIELFSHLRRYFYGAVSRHHGFTLAQLATHLGVSRATVYNKLVSFSFTVDEMHSTLIWLNANGFSEEYKNPYSSPSW